MEITQPFRRAKFHLTGDFSYDEVHSLPELVRFNALHNGAHVFSYYPETRDGPVLKTTFQELSNAIDHCILDLRNGVSEEKSPKMQQHNSVPTRPVAMFLESGMSLFIHIAAFLAMRKPILLLSARLSPTAIQHLLRQTEADSIVTSKRMWSQQQADLTQFDQTINIRYSTPYNFNPVEVSPPLEPVVEGDCKAFILHSSGTTGLPKPIFHPQRYLLTYAACHEFEVDERIFGVNVSSLPLYHGFGLLAPMLSMSVGMPCCFPAPTSLPTAESILALVQSVSAKSLMTVPSVLEDITEALELSLPQLLQLDFVVAGGGPMKPEVAAKLSAKGVKLLNHFGATEIGPLAVIFRPNRDYDWNYLRLRQDMELRLIPVNPESHHEGTYKLVGQPVGHSSSFTLQDTIQLRKGSGRDIKLLGRQDDVIVLANGEKVMPQLMESSLSDLPGVRAALVIGNGQFEVGVLIEPTREGAGDIITLRKSIWTKVLETNSRLDGHAQIFDPSALLIIQDGRRIPRSDKGSVMRQEAYRVFDSDISSAYFQRDNTQLQPFRKQKQLDLTNLETSIELLIRELLQSPLPLQQDKDIFELGLDSLKAMQLQRSISSEVYNLKHEPQRLNRVVYRHPTILGIATQIRSCMRDTIEKDSDRSSSRVMNKFVETYSRDLQLWSPRAADKCILLTGSTGSIGSNLLAHMVKLEDVETVICLNRPEKLSSSLGHRDEAARQRRAFSRYSVDLPDSFWSKITMITTDTSCPYAGLDEGTYAKLSQSLTHIVHNAWPMDFKRSIDSFEDHFKSLTNLLQLAFDAYIVSGRRIRFNFHSSIAVFANTTSITGDDGEVTEAPISDPAVSSEMGYAQAKWVCERIVENAVRSHPSKLNASIIRIGQIVGSTSTGVWNSSEHVPAVIKTAHTLGRLPRIEGTLSWLPVDIAAAAISDILLNAKSDQLLYHVENPTRQNWTDILNMFRVSLDLQDCGREVPLDQWLVSANEAGKTQTLSTNLPVTQLLDFMKSDFKELGTGRVILDTRKSQEISPILRRASPINQSLIRLFVEVWRSEGFLSN
ncbi:hypothetical protein F4678DRAFT_483642 [Xylaria arbuscula]|nr:hypothetical protein F4678DRAFT_483642 [Xylaria arbuscula]